MNSLELFRKMTLSDMSKTLDVLPFDVARHFGQGEGLPVEMLFDSEDLKRVRQEMGLEMFWDGSPFQIEDDEPARRLVREFARRLLALDTGQPSRVDDLARGLVGSDKQLINGAVNAMIKLGVLQSIPLSTGLGVGKLSSGLPVLEKLASGGAVPEMLEQLWT